MDSWLLFLTLIVLLAPIVCLIWREYQTQIKLLETVTQRYRGEPSERKTILKLLRMGIDNRAIFHDCYIKGKNGTYTQVDLVVALSQGLLVFEIKDYSGWIFGNYLQRYWTQVLSYGRQKHRFYNPIMQNDGHIDAIRRNLPHNPAIPIYSIIVFYGSSILKNVVIGSETDYVIYPSEIERVVNELMSRPAVKFGDKYEIMEVLSRGVSNGLNPYIVSAQRRVAHLAGRNRPKSTYNYYFTFGNIFRWFR